MGFQEKIAKAREAGYSDEEIQSYIGQKTEAAKAAGYSDEEIQSFLGGGQQEAPQPEVQNVPGAKPAHAYNMLARLGEGTQNLADRAGEAVAETLAGPGVTMRAVPGFPGMPLPALGQAGQPRLKLPPQAAAVAGLGVQMAPDIAMAALGGPGAVKQGARAVEAAPGRILDTAMDTPGFKHLLSGRAKRLAGKEIGKASEAAGLKTVMPSTKQIARDLNLPKGQQQFSDVVNHMNRALEQGADVPAQTLQDFVAKGDELFKLGQVHPKTTSGAAISKAMKLAREKLNQVVPGRAAGAAKMSKAATRADRVEFLKKVAAVIAKKGLGGAAVAGGGTMAYKMLR